LLRVTNCRCASCALLLASTQQSTGRTPAVGHSHAAKHRTHTCSWSLSRSKAQDAHQQLVTLTQQSTGRTPAVGHSHTAKHRTHTSSWSLSHSKAQYAHQQLVTLSNITSHSTTCCHRALLVQRS